MICGSLMLLSLQGVSQPMTSRELLQQTVNYHDPNGQWPVLRQELFFETDMPEGTVRTSQVKVDNALGVFEYTSPMKSIGIKMDSCYQTKGEPEPCDRIARSRNYYLYLWGLPMKLYDNGTTIDDQVYQERLKGQDYHVLKVIYAEDVWYFYIHPETFALEAYKFYKDDPNQKGEIIYLEGEMQVQGMKIPTSRSWYRTENDEYLATDRLVRTAPL